ALLAVRGTQYDVEVGSGGQTIVDVWEGIVEVRSPASLQPVFVHAGEESMFGKREAPQTPHPIPDSRRSNDPARHPGEDGRQPQPQGKQPAGDGPAQPPKSPHAGTPPAPPQSAPPAMTMPPSPPPPKPSG